YRLHPSQWRPPDVLEQENAFRADIARRLSPRVDDAWDVLRAGELLRAADLEYSARRFRDALVHLFAAVRTAPSFLRSPIVLPAFVHLALKASVGALLGPRASRMVSSMRDRVRRRLRRTPEARVMVAENVRALPGRSRGYVSVG